MSTRHAAPGDLEALSAELEAKLLRRLKEEWGAVNYTYFRERLRPPVLRLSDTRQRLGQWNGALRSLEISRPLVLERPWVEVLEVLKHEVAHQFVDEVLQADEQAHGPQFRRVCEHLGIEGWARWSGREGEDGAPRQAVVPRTVAKVRKLLALAGSHNQHEAEAAASAARRLMLKFNLELQGDAATSPDALARALGGAASSDRARYGFAHLGRPSGRILEHDRRLATILSSYFFVECLWIPVYRPKEGKRGSVLEICGLPANLMMAEHVHAFLSETALRLWVEYKGTTGRSSNRDRQAFLAGVMRGFEGKLEGQDAQLQEEGLVWVPGPELGAYLRRRYPRVQTVRRGGARRNEAYSEGQRVGREIVLSRPVQEGPSGRKPKALRGGGGRSR